jgi:DNA repair exonuclease SbcCD ATPase subunit
VSPLAPASLRGCASLQGAPRGRRRRGAGSDARGNELPSDAHDAAASGGSGGQRSIRQRLSTQAEDTIGKLADDLLANDVINSALQRALDAREKVAQAQESAMGALNLPSASNLDKLARRLRSISQRLEEIEDSVDRVDRRVEEIRSETKHPAKLEERLDRIESRIDELAREVAAIRRDSPSGETVSAAQTRAVVPEG